MSAANEKRLPQRYTRPDLRWVEELLGESLKPAVYAGVRYYPAVANSDTSGIPWGRYCYDPEAENSPLCPHFSYTDIGMAKCAHLNIVAYIDFFDDETDYVRTNFASVEAAHAAGVVHDWELRDRYKVCNINQQGPGRALELGKLIADYRAEVESQPCIDAPTTDRPRWNLNEMTDWMICTAWTRLELWKYMTGMVQDIPPELIYELMVADKRFRVKTFPANEPMHTDFAQSMPLHDNPKRQYWYMYRKSLGDPEQHELLHDPIGFFPPALPGE